MLKAEAFMAEALREAAKDENEVPVGAVVVRDGEIIARAHNERGGDAPVAHAEMLALTAAAEAKGAWRLSGTRLYVTKEPCPMCAGAIILARPDTVVWGVSDPKRGGGTVFGIFDHPGINHHPQIVTGVLEEPCRNILQDFFRARRLAVQQPGQSPG